MFIKKKKYNILEKSISELNKTLQEGNLLEISYILGNKKEMLKRNLIAGIFRGVGIGIGVTIITAILIILLQKIVSLNIPVIGEYIADIVDIVQRSRWTLGTLHFVFFRRPPGIQGHRFTLFMCYSLPDVYSKI